MTTCRKGPTERGRKCGRGGISPCRKGLLDTSHLVGETAYPDLQTTRPDVEELVT